MFTLSSALKNIYDNGDDEYFKLLKSIEPLIDKVKYSQGEVLNLSPYFLEINELKKGKWLTNIPNLTSDIVRYGFDIDGKIKIVTLYTDLAGVTYDTLFIEKDNYIELRTYVGLNTDKELSRVSFFYYENNHLSKVETYSERSLSLEIYKYKEGILTKIIKQQKEHFSENVVEHIYKFINKDTKPGRVIKTRKGSPKEHIIELLCNHKEDKKELDKTLNALNNALFNKIIATVKNMNFNEKVHCVALIDDAATKNYGVPLLAIGLLNDIANYKRSDDHILWNPIDFSYFDVEALDLNTPEIQKIYLSLNSRKVSNSQIVAVYNHIITQMSSYSWDLVCPVNKDMIVFYKEALD